MGSTSTCRLWIEGHMAFGCRNTDLFQSQGSCFSHRIPAARSSGKRALYISRENRQCCPTLVSLSMSRSMTRSLLLSSEVKISQLGSVCTAAWTLKDQLEGAFAEPAPMRASEDKAQERMTIKGQKSLLGRRASSIQFQSFSHFILGCMTDNY